MHRVEFYHKPHFWGALVGGSLGGRYIAKIPTTCGSIYTFAVTSLARSIDHYLRKYFSLNKNLCKFLSLSLSMCIITPVFTAAGFSVSLLGGAAIITSFVATGFFLSF